MTEKATYEELEERIRILEETVKKTDCKLAEEAHLEDEAKYRTLFEYANDAIFLLRGERIIDCNKKTWRCLDARWNKLSAKLLTDFHQYFNPEE